MLKRVFAIVFVCVLMSCYCLKVSAENKNGIVVSNGYFSLIMPGETKNTYTIKKENKALYICEKISAKANLGGFAFGLKIYKEPKDYVENEDARKIGELVDKNGTTYDMVLIKPREIRYGDGEKIEKNFERLYAYADNVEINGINGTKYYKNKGMKGRDLYIDILKKYKTAIEEKWDTEQYGKEFMGNIYPTLSKSSKKLLNKIGYVYYDINADGIDELIIGEISNGKNKGIIYDIYTVVNRKPMHVLSGGREEKYFVCNDHFLWSESPMKLKEKTCGVYMIKKNSTELIPHVMFVYNANKNKKNPWFVSHGLYGQLENVSEETFNETRSLYDAYKRFDYIPLSELK